MKAIMKSFVSTFVLIAALSLAVTAAEKVKFKVISIHTSAICGSCKVRIEKTLKAIDGVDEAILNLNTKVVKVKYNPEKVSPGIVRNAISEVGYDADDVKKNESSFAKLPQCCQVAMPGDKH